MSVILGGIVGRHCCFMLSIKDLLLIYRLLGNQDCWLVGKIARTHLYPTQQEIAFRNHKETGGDVIRIRVVLFFFEIGRHEQTSL
jgi:hypothetical protein